MFLTDVVRVWTQVNKSLFLEFRLHCLELKQDYLLNITEYRIICELQIKSKPGRRLLLLLLPVWIWRKWTSL